MRQDYDNGKYTVIFNECTGAMHVLRNGEVWQDLSGNNLVYWMLVEHKRALDRIAELEKDAGRYRIASEQDNFCDFVIHAFGCYCDDKESADRVIDTAMQKD